MMRFRLSLFFISVILLCQCRQSLRAQWGERKGEATGKMNIGGLARNYFIFVPDNRAGKSLPLVIALHGFGGDGETMERLTGFESIAAREKFILVYPNGIKKGWNDGRGRNEGIDDVAFISALIDTVHKTYSTDSLKVYVTGMSNGGFMTNRLACELSAKIAAAAPAAGTLSTIIASGCVPKMPVSMLLIHGTKDPLVPFEGGESKTIKGSRALGHDDMVKHWVQLNHCSTEDSVAQIPDTAHDGTKIEIQVYDLGTWNTEVISMVVENGGHTWPGSYPFFPDIIGRTSQNMNASEVIWAFFKRHHR